jgi:uncharacterized membrane-anchored protein YjiN (DUF445 family)
MVKKLSNSGSAVESSDLLHENNRLLKHYAELMQRNIAALEENNKLLDSMNEHLRKIVINTSSFR